MDFIKYLNPQFDPSSLRVIDLRNLLNQNGIHWSSRHRKSDLIDIFNYELVPKLKREIEKDSTISKKSKSKDNSYNKENISSEISPPLNSKKNNDDKIIIPKKRKIVESDDIKDTKPYNEFSSNIKRNIKRKRNFSTLDKQLKKRKKKDIKDNDMINNGNIFNRNLEIKFNKPNENFKINKDDNNKEHILNEIDTTNIPIKEENENHLISNENININNNKDIDNIEDSNIDSSNIEESSIIKNNSEIDFNNQNFQSTPIKVKLENSLLGPTNKIKAIEDDNENNENNLNQIYIKQEILENDIKDKLEEIDSLNTKIDEDLNQISYNNNLNNQIISSQSFNSSNNITLDNDTAELTQLQNLFEIETSKIEIESEKVLNIINSKDKFIYYKSKFIKIIIIWIILLILSFILAIYRQERIQVGFCDYEIRNKGSFLNKLFNLRLKCIKCPDHGICSGNSKLYCLPDYIIKYPFFWSFGGLIPTFNKCILDSTKIKKINKIIKYIINLLSNRNANIQCGNGTDEEVGLNWNQIIEIINQKLLIDINDDNYNYIWDKVKIILSTRTDLKFLELPNQNDLIIRSISLSKLSIKCRLKRLILMILIKYKLYFLSISLILIIFLWIFNKINLIQRQNHYYNNVLKEILNKLQKQSNEYKKTKFGKPYIAKIQLRDYYLPQLQKLSKKHRNDLWREIVKTVESNSNIKTEDIEINGDIMRVWSWCSDI